MIGILIFIYIIGVPLILLFGAFVGLGYNIDDKTLGKHLPVYGILWPVLVPCLLIKYGYITFRETIF